MKEKDLSGNQKIYRTISSFIDLIKNNPDQMKIFPDKPIDLRPEAEYTVSTSSKGRKDACIKMSDQETKFQVSGGQWFEELVGYQFLQAGAEEVSVRVRVAWSNASQGLLETRHEHVTHRNDIDVIARFNGKYFMISCKSGKKFGVGKECEQADFHAKTVAHFAVPMLCYLKHDGDPYQESKTKNFVFGHQTLMNSEFLHELCEQAYAARQTTRN